MVSNDVLAFCFLADERSVYDEWASMAHKFPIRPLLDWHDEECSLNLKGGIQSCGMIHCLAVGKGFS